MAYDFTGKQILVTGASSGIGKGITLALVKAGAEVYALSNEQDKLDALKAESGAIHTIYADLTDWDDVKGKLDELEAMDGLVNNAGKSCGLFPALDQTTDVIEESMAVNAVAPVNVTQLVAKKMMAARKPGSIVNICSLAGVYVFQGLLGYGMSKAALNFATKQFATELGPYKIRVNAINPTFVMTDLSRQWLAEHSEEFGRATPLGRPAEVMDVVGPTLYLLSDASAMVTGTSHVIDGGLSATSGL